MSQSASCAIRCYSISRSFHSVRPRSIWSLSPSISPTIPLALSSIKHTFKNSRKSWEVACKRQFWDDSVDNSVGNWDEFFYADQKRSQEVTDYLNELSAEQRIAVNASSKVVRVIAGPGSGKTRVLISRAAKLISEGVHPENIMMLTFTNKAAAEMKSRLQNLFGKDYPDIKKLSNGTFHSVCTKILRKHISKFKDGRKGSFQIIDDDQKEKIILDVLMEHYSITILENDSPKTVTAKKKQNTKLRREQREKAKMYSRKISHLKETSKTVYGLRGEDIRDQMESWKQPENKDLVWVFDKYQNCLSKENLCDFGDLVGNVVLLLSMFPSVRSELKSRFRHILVDEMQDTNLPQYEMIRLLIRDNKDDSEFGKNTLFAVGDPNQAIYSFRGARVENLDKSMEHQFGGLMETLYLLDNYRSQAPIVRYAEGILKRFIHRSSYSQMVVVRKDNNHQQLRNVVSNDEDEEALTILMQIEDLTKCHGYELNDIAIFYRSHRLCLKLEEAFRRSMVPYCVVKGQSFMKRSEIRDVLAYLRFVANPRDEYAFERIVNKPSRGIGDKTIDNLKAWAEKNGTRHSQWLVADLEDHWKKSKRPGEAFQVPKLDFPKEIRLSKRAKEGIQELREIYCRLRVAARDASVKGAIQCLMQDCGYEQFLREEHEEEAQFELAKLHVETLMNSVPENLEQDKDKLSGLKQFVQGVALSASTDGSVGDEKKGVQLMTIHAAKGLEFPVVILVGCEDGLLPVRLDDSVFEEETRLMFVAVTRAKDIVIFSRAAARRIRGVMQLTTPSPFLQPIMSTRSFGNNRLPLASQN